MLLYKLTSPEELHATRFSQRLPDHGGWYFESQIGSDVVLECCIFSGDNDLATLIKNLAGISPYLRSNRAAMYILPKSAIFEP